MKNVRLHCFSIPFGASGSGFPKEKRILANGDNPTTKGTLKIGPKTRALFAANQKATGFERIAVDFEHNTLPGTEAFKESREPREVAAYATPQLREDGLWLADIEWTPAGRDKGLNYADMSPAPGMTDDGEVIFLHSVGLVRNGSVYNLGAFSAAEGMQMDMPMTADRTSEEETSVMEKILCVLRKGLGLDEKADETAIAKALEAVNLQAFGAKLADIEKRLSEAAKVQPFSAESGAGLLKEIGDLKSALENHQRTDLVAQAAREGKVIPLSAEQIAATPIATLADMVAKLESTVPMEKRTGVVVPHSASGRKTLTEEQKKIAQRCNVDIKKLEDELNK